MRLDELSQPGREDAADTFCEIDEKYGISELRVPAVVQPHTDDDSAAPALTTFGEVKKCVEFVPGILQMPQGTSRPGSSHIRLGVVKLQSNTSISGLEPPAERHTSSLLQVMPVEPVSFYPCI